MHSADYAVARCLSVCLSVTRRYCIETANGIVKLLTFSVPNVVAIFRRGRMQVGYEKTAIFDEYLDLSWN